MKNQNFKFMENKQTTLTFGIQVTYGEVNIINYEIFLKQATALSQQAINLLVDSSNLNDAKSIKAKLNSVIKQIDRERIDKKNLYLEAWNVCENKLKKLTEILNEGSETLKANIELVEQQFLDKKTEEICNLYKENIDKNNELPIDKIWDKKYLNKGYTIDKVIKELEEKYNKFFEDINNLSVAIQEPIERELAIDEYKATLNFSLALSKGLERQARKQQIISNNNQENNLSNRDDDTIPHTTRLIITATKKQMINLKNYLVENHINYKLESKGE